jgi:hypothetical protein
MNSLSTSEKEKILSRLFWDSKNVPFNLERFIEENLHNLKDPQSQQFLSRLLSSCDWYTLLKLLPIDRLRAILNDDILSKLFPKELKNKYIYARNVLSR